MDFKLSDDQELIVQAYKDSMAVPALSSLS